METDVKKKSGRYLTKARFVKSLRKDNNSKLIQQQVILEYFRTIKPSLTGRFKMRKSQQSLCLQQKKLLSEYVLLALKNIQNQKLPASMRAESSQLIQLLPEVLHVN